MIFYFSGTGNSRWVAESIAYALNERLMPVSEAFATGTFSYALAEGEALGFVFPTYSWGPAPVMTEFVKRMRVNGLTGNTYCYMVTTCGDDVGLSPKMWQEALGEIRLSAAFSVQMPNNYILLPGFDVDPKELEDRKKRNALKRVEEVCACVAERREVTDVVPGSFAWLKSRIIYPWFIRYSMSDKKFTVNEHECRGCGVCVKSCPMKNITLTGAGVPEWHGHCAMCLACIHRCPYRAIEYGHTTQKKGRYFFKKLSRK